MSELQSIKEAHHTDVYSYPGLVVRRGQSFPITLNFNSSVSDWKSIIFTAQTGPPVEKPSKTKVVFPVTRFLRSGSWGAIVESSPANSLNVIIASPANAIIGRYELSVQITFDDQPTTFNLGNFVMLFNPWVSDDDVYMADEEERKEYILNENGMLFMGNEKSINTYGWNYGQFEDNILNICLELLDRNTNYRNDPVSDCSQRNDATYVGRIVSAMVNSNDEYGVVEGRWEKDFPGGVDPTTWSGSVEILRKWQSDGYQPVKYGQCWVFAGVMCTVLRCLGIPTRAVTNFHSAHNTDGNLAIDLFYDENGKFLDDMTKDSIWNFHMWNESWFIRRDLGAFYDGWQVLDSTPQEESQGLFRCGPTSVKAVKEGDIQLRYDAPFVFAEVNADRTNWVYYGPDRKERVHSDTYYIGQMMSTKAVGSDERVDITDTYKYPEGSEKEREAFNKALRRLQISGTIENESVERNATPRLPNGVRDPQPRTTTQDGGDGAPTISGKFKLTSGAMVGEDINLILNLKNLSAETKKVQVKISCSSILYTGRRIQDIFTDNKFATLGPKGETNIPLVIYYTEYGSYLGNNSMLAMTALCEVLNEEKLLVRKDISLDNPSVHIRFRDQPIVYEPVNVEIKFVNPLMLTVNDCILVAEGSGLIDGQIRAELPPMRPRERMRFKLEITPWKAGPRQLLVRLASRRFSMKGFKTVVVAPW
ncbi:hypothetical protein NDU88_002401 [Pleurodeles waltl]|uniref:protein-glutamine gamma-glutamyltransferase n=1 Tax=Pleurodeles waltl TaxID=8319 RepID=A0AAV7PAR7_PLEWA|nr:hypothetical protein NDU88_002401 [Pleurodeles waltl]